MKSLKVNLYISHAPEDKAFAMLLMEWLYSMRDEVNLWRNDPPRPLQPLSLPWRFLLPWYRPVEPQVLYAEALKNRKENAHIYVFLLSDNALKNKQVQDDIALALSRRADCAWDELGPMVFPLVLKPCKWRENTRLTKFEPLLKGKEIASFKPLEEGFLTATEQLSAQIKTLQAKLNEARFFQLDQATDELIPIKPGSKFQYPYLGENPSRFSFNPPEPFRPPEWLGWSLIALLFMLSVGSFRKNPRAVTDLHLKARPDKEPQTEYPRYIPPTPPPPGTQMVFPPPD